MVTSFSRDEILTAGHCVAEPAGGGQVRWANNLLFAPGYRDGDTPLGTYVATNAATPGIWAAEGDIAFDCRRPSSSRPSMAG